MVRTPDVVVESILKKTLEFDRRVENLSNKLQRGAYGPFQKIDRNSETILDDADEVYSKNMEKIKATENDFEDLKKEYYQIKSDFIKYAKGKSLDTKILDEIEGSFEKIDRNLSKLPEILEQKYTEFMRSL